jgi:hypothetical protein
MGADKSLVSSYEDFLKNVLYNFVYFPTTNWQHALSPTFNFGCNVQDVEVEHQVLDKVGSYGSQLNRVLDVLSVLVADLDRSRLTRQEQQFVDKYEELARNADEAASEIQGTRRHGVTHADINRMIDALGELKKSNPAGYREIVERLHQQLPLAQSD